MKAFYVGSKKNPNFSEYDYLQSLHCVYIECLVRTPVDIHILVNVGKKLN